MLELEWSYGYLFDRTAEGRVPFRAETDVRTLSLASWDFLPLIDRHPSIARKMLVEMSRRLRDAEDSITH